MSEGVIIQASSRSRGNTEKVVSFFKQNTGFDIIDLKTKNIEHFNYDFQNKEDDFNSLFKEIVNNYQIIVFATPVYWYSMSGILKVFFDRISDFLIQEKEYGRKLRGKEMAVISCGSNEELLDGFIMPFKESANYLGISFLGHAHTWIENEIIPENVQQNLMTFVQDKLNQKQIKA